MGEHNIKSGSDADHLRVFTQRLLDDVRALERMLEDGLFETGVTRIGAEQELFLVDAAHCPAAKALEVLEAIDDPHFTTELALFNLEFNLDPLGLTPDCLSRLENQVHELLDLARKGARQVGADVVLTGILPTIDKIHLSLDNMTPMPRYRALDEAIHRMRGSAFEFYIKGRDELTLTHDSVMLESCNTSFQVHFQVDPEDFPRLYNVAQVVAAPVLAAATNSPLLFGRSLWRETRIALFQQAVDTRQAKSHRRQLPPRVSFGERWVDESVLEIFREDIARFRVLLSCEVEEDPLELLARGEAPALKALRLHNGTVYRWNRPCYGVYQGKPHLRIENRVLPSGPTVIDEVANAAFWFGLIKAISEEHGDVTRHFDFEFVKENFLAASRLGLRAQFHWMQHRSLPAQEVILKHLLPHAREGLVALGVDKGEGDRYLDVVEERVRSWKTGAQWMLDSLASLKREGGTPTERLVSITAASMARQQEGAPVHTWPPARLRESEGWKDHYRRVGSLMSTDLFTVNEDEVIDLVACLMDWQHIRHVPVEDNAHRLVGIVTHRTLMRLLAHERGKPQQAIPVRRVMQKKVITVDPETSTLEAIRLMKQHKIGCLPVVENDRLVGIVTEHDFIKIAGQLLEEFLST